MHFMFFQVTVQLECLNVVLWNTGKSHCSDRVLQPEDKLSRSDLFCSPAFASANLYYFSYLIVHQIFHLSFT